jgi:transposase-like protein
MPQSRWTRRRCKCPRCGLEYIGRPSPYRKTWDDGMVRMHCQSCVHLRSREQMYGRGRHRDHLRQGLLDFSDDIIDT